MALAISSRLLHDPVSFLKNDSCKEQHDVKVEMIRAAFGLVDKY